MSYELCPHCQRSRFGCDPIGSCRTAATRPPPPVDLSLSELDRYADAEIADHSRGLARAQNLKRLIERTRNPELTELEQQ